MITFFKIILYEPLYNLLVFLTGLIPGGDVGVAIVLLTLLVKAILLPLQHRFSKTQLAMRGIQAEIEGLKKKHASDRQKLALETMALYRKHGINPFAGFLLLLIQIPILISLYYVFARGLPFTADVLYSFVNLPTEPAFLFLGLVDITTRSIPLAVLAGISQFVQMRLAVPPVPPKTKGQEASLADDFARSMNINMRYVMPAIILFISLGLPSAIVLYWVTSNLFQIGHELLVRKRALSLYADKKPSPQA